MAVYRIHPGIGVARLGDSGSEFYLSPETPGGVPVACDETGNPRHGPDGVTPVLVAKFRDSDGRIKRQAARFQIFVYDDESPDGRPLRLGDPVEGGGNRGVLVDIRWRVWLANKKACWYEFDATLGEHGYPSTAHRRNDNVRDAARDDLIIDPGPRIVNGTDKRRARFDRDGEGAYATTFPPPLTPHSIDTLGEMLTDNLGRLIVLGGHGRSGADSVNPRIGNYANNDGWYDDTSDGPVMARLVMFSKEVQSILYIDVEYPAWVIVGYPRFAPQILDIVTADDVIYDLGLRLFASDTSIYGVLDTFDDPQSVDARDAGQLSHWLASRLAWNREFRPWFFRDVWPILFRPDEYRWLSDALGQSNFPHDQQDRGTFDPEKLSQPPQYFATREERDRAANPERERVDAPHSEASFETTKAADGPDARGRWTLDPYRAMRRFLFDLLRRPGEENEFKLADRIGSRVHNLPLMPLLCGDNPLTNTTPSKFLRLTDYQLFVLKQWADGKFIDDRKMGWTPPDYTPFIPYPTAPPVGGRALDRGVLANVLGGAFCPGGEFGWIMRNPSAFYEPYRIKADRRTSDFFQTAAQANQVRSGPDIADFTFSMLAPLSQNSDLARGLQPGDPTKSMALPWQADFNECSTEIIDVTYTSWNLIYPVSENDAGMSDRRMSWETMWWPAHRPLQVYEDIGDGSFQQLDWSRGVPQTNAGDLKMVTEWSRLPFVVLNPALTPEEKREAPDLYSTPKFIAVERKGKTP
jgi:L-Lysine epsilon oxidase N-terminal/L-lysine epsilon oxidase C-terminal domain